MGPMPLELLMVAVGQNDQMRIVVTATGFPEVANMVAEALAQEVMRLTYILLSSSGLFFKELPPSAVT